ncbi:MAG: hypothetical protein JJU40_06360 [Rhodobacteraceae bacterium]|nr:hypothetical protein [Paracoccaceae bacterium]
MRRAAFAAALVALPGAASAEAVLSLTFDGALHRFVPEMEGARTGFSRFATLQAVSIEGSDGPARLVLEMSLLPGARAGDAPYAARISFRPDGWRDYWVSPPELPGGAVSVELFDLSGPAPRIAGRFEAPLCFTPTPLHPPDPARCRTAAGRFDTPLVPD